MTGRFFFLNLAAGVYERAAFDAVGHFDPDLLTSDDWDWFFRARERGVRMLVHESIVLYHRRHADNLTRRQAQRNHQDLIWAVHKSLNRRRGQGREALPPFSSLR